MLALWSHYEAAAVIPDVPPHDEPPKLHLQYKVTRFHPPITHIFSLPLDISGQTQMAHNFQKQKQWIFLFVFFSITYLKRKSRNELDQVKLQYFLFFLFILKQ